ncbi:transmembrane protein 235-like, partial [Scleropages formosus]
TTPTGGCIASETPQTSRSTDLRGALTRSSGARARDPSGPHAERGEAQGLAGPRSAVAARSQLRVPVLRPPPRADMRMSFGTAVVVAGFAGVLSFALLAAAIGSEYWYIIEVRTPNESDSEELSSHSGLWRIYEGTCARSLHGTRRKNSSSHIIYSFSIDTTKYSEPERHLLSLHKVIVILLPLSLVLLVFGGIFGLVSSLARSHGLLSGTAVYLLVCSLLTLSGVSIYISYSQLALAELRRVLGAEHLAHVHVSFGWSLGVAWLSFGLEVLAGLLLLLAARIAFLQHRHESGARGA